MSSSFDMFRRLLFRRLLFAPAFCKNYFCWIRAYYASRRLDRKILMPDNTDKKMPGYLVWISRERAGRRMYMVYRIKEGKKLKSLFAGWEESLIWSCLQGNMGYLYADAQDEPHSAMAILGDFSFLAGEPNRELAAFKPDWCKQDFIIAVPQERRWADLIEECFQEKARKVVRYAMKKEPDVFDRKRLQNIVDGLSPEYTICLLNEELYDFCRKEDWCRDFVSQFSDWKTYRELGIGVLILKDGVPVAGASSYSAYSGGEGGNGGIEIEIDTRKEFRRRGLASICGARLILECLDRGLYPSWDAQNPWSVSLAEKLGYHFDHEYTAYEIWGY